MLPPGRAQSATADRPAPLVGRVHGAIAGAPVLARPVLAVLAVVALPWLLAPISVYSGLRTKMASLYVAAFGTWTFCVIDLDRAPASSASGNSDHVQLGWWLALMATPFAIAGIAHVRPLARWFVPCRTVAWALLWSLPVSFLIVQAWWQHAEIAAIAVWVTAAAVIGWRAAKGSQEARMFGPQGVLAGPGAPGPPNAPPAPPQGPPPGPRTTGPLPRGGHQPQYGTRAQGVAQVYADRAGRALQPCR